QWAVAATYWEVSHFAFDPAHVAPVASGSSRISCRTALWNLFWSRGGNSAEDGQFAADNAYGVEKGQPVRILIPAQRGFVHEATDCEMRRQQTVELLSYQVRRLAPQNDARSPQMSLEFVECGFDFPTFVIDRRQFGSRRQFVVEDRGRQAIQRFGPLNSFEAVIDHPHRHAIGPMPLVLFRDIDTAQIRAVRQTCFTGQPHVLFEPPQ